MAEWKECKLQDLCVLQRGHDLPRSEMKEGIYPVAGSNGIIGYHNAYTTKAPGVTIGRSGSIGETYYFENDYWAHNTVLFVKDFKNSDPKFVYYFLKRLDFDQFNAGSAVPTLNRNHIHDLVINIPEPDEQRAIASILSSLDDKIDLLHRQNKTLEALAETLFRQWFVEEAIWNGKLSDYIKVQGGFAFKSQDFREEGFAGVIKITNITMGSVDIRNTQFVDEEIVKDVDEDKFRVRTGDFLIAMTGAEIGKIGIVEKTDKQIWLNQRVGKLIEKVPFGNLVGYLALKSREGQEHIMNTCSGSAQENISSSGIENMDFVPYSENIVNQFGDEGKTLFENIIFNMEQIRTLTQLRDTLLPKLMSGEVRVKEN